MSHWFHRNKLKSTIDQKFDGKGSTKFLLTKSGIHGPKPIGPVPDADHGRPEYPRVKYFSGTAIKTNATKLLNDLRITRQNLLATFIDEVAKPEQVFVSKIPPF